MDTKLRVFLISIIVLLILAILDLVRRKKLKEKYSLLWIVTGVSFIVMALWPDSVKFLSASIGIITPSNLIFLLAVFFLIILSIHFSMIISALGEKTKLLAQELALLKKDLDSERKDAGT